MQSPPTPRRKGWPGWRTPRAAPKIPEWERIASRIARHAEAAVRGEETPAAALDALDRETDVLLEKRRWLLARRER